METKITLQEQVFMKDLIMRNYRRRLLVFLIILLFTITVVIYTLVAGIKSIEGISAAILSVFCLSAMTIKYGLDIWTPWYRKNRELETLRNHVFGQSNFEELKNSVAMSCYFDLI